MRGFVAAALAVACLASSAAAQEQLGDAVVLDVPCRVEGPAMAADRGKACAGLAGFFQTRVTFVLNNAPVHQETRQQYIGDGSARLYLDGNGDPEILTGADSLLRREGIRVR